MAGDVVTIPEALVHTGVSMGTVFVVLILISFVIYLLKFVPKLFERREKKPEPVQVKKAEPAPVVKTEKTESTDVKGTDPEIVAVIAAAIAASMTEEKGVPVAPEGLVIRSIKKRVRTF